MATENYTIVRRARLTPEDATVAPSDGDAHLHLREGRPPVIVQQRDGSEKLSPTRPSDTMFVSGLQPVQLDRAIDPGVAMQLGLHTLLKGMRAWRIGLDDYINNRDLQSSEFGLARIFFDWPRFEDAVDPMPSVALTLPEEEVYDAQGLHGGTVLEETVERWGPGTVLKKTGVASTTVHAVIWSAHKEERRALKKALLRLFLTEPNEEMSGRRVVVPQYFERVARYELKGTRYEDDPQSAHSNEWIMTARITAEIDIVDLVKRPPYMEAPTINVSTSGLDD